MSSSSGGAAQASRLGQATGLPVITLYTVFLNDDLDPLSAEDLGSVKQPETLWTGLRSTWRRPLPIAGRVTLGGSSSGNGDARWARIGTACCECQAVR